MIDFNEALGGSVVQASLINSFIQKRLDNGESRSAAAAGANLDYQRMMGLIPPQK